jgi:hypothetical protein
MTRLVALPLLVRLLAGFYLLLAGIQVLLFAPAVSGGRSLDFLTFRVDALSLAFGAVWTLALGLGLLALVEARQLAGRAAGILFIFSAGLLDLAYTREPLLFLVGWEIAGLAVWLWLQELGWAGNIARCAFWVHAPGLLLLAAILLGPGVSFIPPQGGEAVAWPLVVAISFGVVALIRAGCWPFLAQDHAIDSAFPLISLYSLAAPFLLAKALVAASWDDIGVWALALLGTVVLLGSLLARFLGSNSSAMQTLACAAAGVAGLGLAPLSPLAAAGAVALLLGGALWVVAGRARPDRGALLLSAALPGIWLLSQGALDARYRLVAAILLPALLLLAYRADSEAERTVAPARLPSIVAACLLILVAVYPQAVVEWVLRPAVGAMAGGVGVPSTLVTNWGLGLLVESPQERVLAALPATGIALAIFLAWVALYWLRGLARMVTGDRLNQSSEISDQSSENPQSAIRNPQSAIEGSAIRNPSEGEKAT